MVFAKEKIKIEKECCYYTKGDCVFMRNNISWLFYIYETN